MISRLIEPHSMVPSRGTSIDTLAQRSVARPRRNAFMARRTKTSYRIFLHKTNTSIQHANRHKTIIYFYGVGSTPEAVVGIAEPLASGTCGRSRSPSTLNPNRITKISQPSITLTRRSAMAASKTPASW